MGDEIGHHFSTKVFCSGPAALLFRLFLFFTSPLGFTALCPIAEPGGEEKHFSLHEFKNFILIFEDGRAVDYDLDKLQGSEVGGDQLLLSLKDVINTKFLTFQTKLDKLEYSVIVLTTRDGSRGTDFKGKERAYVIINLDPITTSEF